MKIWLIDLYSLKSIKFYFVLITWLYVTGNYFFALDKYTKSLVSLVCEALDFFKCFFYMPNPINKYSIVVIKPAKTA